MTKYARQLLTECLLARGLADRTAIEQTVGAILDLQMASGMLAPSRLDDWEREAHVYHLRKTETVGAIQVRSGLGERAIYKAIERHKARRHAALKVVVYQSVA
jgi:hypothetical protein